MQILVFSFCLAYNLSFKIFPLFWIFGIADTGCFLQHFWWHYSITHMLQKYFILTSFTQMHTFHKHSDIKINRKWLATHSNCLEIFNNSILIMLANKTTLAKTISSYSQWHNSLYFSVPYFGALQIWVLDRVQWQAFINKVINFQLPWNYTQSALI
jgi:hypothetical protein